MKLEGLLAASALALGVLAGPAAEAGSPGDPPVPVRAGLDHSVWTRLLEKYTDRGLVDYAAWKRSPEDLRALSSYLARIALPATPPARDGDLEASLVNAYNAATVDWILRNYPTQSIQSLPGSFTSRRLRMGGQAVSLDDIEHGTLRPLLGFRVHAALSCASRSCPPLARHAYTPETLDRDLDRRMRLWLGRPDMNRFDPASKKALISQIFRWYAADFEKVGGVRRVLARYAPDPYIPFLTAGDFTIEYLPYDWGLNDQGAEGRGYGAFHLLWDKLRHRLGF